MKGRANHLPHLQALTLRSIKLATQKIGCPKIPDSDKTKINKQEAQINSLQNQNTQLKGLLELKLLVDAISLPVTTSLKISSQSISKGGAGTTGTGYVSKP